MSPGVEIARDLILLGAESSLATPDEEVVWASDGWHVYADRWRALGERMRRQQVGADPLRLALMDDLALAPGEYWAFLLCAAVEVYPEAAAAASILAEDDRLSRITPTVAARLLRAALDMPYEEALLAVLEGGRAATLGLLDVTEPIPGRPVTQRALGLVPCQIARVLGDRPPAPEPGRLQVQREPRADAIAFAPARVRGGADLLAREGILCLRSASPRVARQFALDLANLLGRDALFVGPLEEAPAPEVLLRLLDGLLVLDLHAGDQSLGVPVAELQRVAEALDGLLVMVPLGAACGQLASLHLEPLGQEIVHRVWVQVLDDADAAADLARRFHLNLLEVREALREARAWVQVEYAEDRPPSSAEIARFVRAQGARRMGRSVMQLATDARMEDLVVPPRLRAQLDDVIGWHRHGERVYGEMGLPADALPGRGLSCLFSGPSGTGKTFASQCLARELGLNLYRVDLSQVVSKYIGETEKALSRVFDEAEAGHGLLLFDEADALFGKRSEVKDAHDRYANLEVGYLLQRMETYTGVSVLATNLRQNMDPAFQRRIRFLLDFPVPDRAMRARLWEQSLPGPAFRMGELHLDALAERFPLTGGSIHSIGVAAAHLAAATRAGRISIEHLVRATYRELEKIGQPRTAEDFGPLAGILERAI